ncbi:MAG: hypothetical protein ABIH11_01885 [Candidatus Altiarchaeota archaeon]
MDERYSRVLDAVAKEDSIKLRELASEYSDDAAINQDKESLQLAVITYSFHKIFSKIHFREKTESLVESSIKKLSEGMLEGVIGEIESFDREHGLFHGGLVGKARIKIGSRIYSRGISITHASTLSGAPVSEILEYSGDTKHHEEKERVSLSDRLNKARDVFMNGK